MHPSLSAEGAVFNLLKLVSSGLTTFYGDSMHDFTNL